MPAGLALQHRCDKTADDAANRNIQKRATKATPVAAFKAQTTYLSRKTGHLPLQLLSGSQVRHCILPWFKRGSLSQTSQDPQHPGSEQILLHAGFSKGEEGGLNVSCGLLKISQKNQSFLIT